MLSVSTPGAGQHVAPFVPGEVLIGLEGSYADHLNVHANDRDILPAQAHLQGAPVAQGKVLQHVPAQANRPDRLTTKWELAPGTDVWDAIEQLQGLPGVAYAEPNYIVTKATVPNDSRFSSLWGMDNPADTDIDAPEAWEIHTGSRNTVVGVIDSGINYNHSDLAGNIWVNLAECPGGLGTCVANNKDEDGNGYVDDFYGWDFVNDDNDPLADDQHGTHVSGTIGAVGNNGTGVAGVNWQVQLMALKFLDGNGSGSTADAVEALNYLHTTIDKHGTGINVAATNNSWGGGAFSQALLDAIDQSAARDVLFVAAAGNNGSSSASYPALYDADNIISVAATDDTDTLASFSNFGTGVDIAAPGVGILSTYNSNYRSLDGTSMASPHVAGAAALVYDLMGPGATYSEVRDLLMNSVDTEDASGQPLNLDVGWGGRLNVYKALQDVTMHVVASEPTEFEVVSAVPNSVILTFSQNAMTPIPLPVLGALDLGGALYDLVSVDGNQITFAGAAPSLSEGPFTMQLTDTGRAAISADKALWDANAQPFSATVFFDTNRLEVDSLSTDSPTDAADVIDLPTDTVVVTVTFNEEIDATTVDVTDLIVNQGKVITADAVNLDDTGGPKAATYTIAGLTEEGTLSLLIPEGAVSDDNGNPVLQGSFERHLDVTSRGFPSPLTGVQPLGSLIYEGTETGIIHVPGDVDEFPLAIDAGQRLSVIVRPDGDWQPSLSIPELGWTSTPGSPGENVVAQTLEVLTDTTVTLSVSSAGTVGAYQIDVVLNAAIDDDDNLAAPQNIDASFLTLGTNALSSRGGVRGTLTPLIAPITTENEVGDDFLSKQNDLRGSWTRVDGSSTWKINGGAGVTGRVGDRSGSGPLASTDGQDTFYFTVLEGDQLTATALGFSVDIHDETGDILVSGLKADGSTLTYIVPDDGDGVIEELEYWLHVWDAKGDYTLTLDRVTPADLAPGNDKIDQFEFSVSAGDALRIAGDAGSDLGTLQIEVYDQSGTTLLASSAPTSRLDAWVEYAVPSDATDSSYRLRIFAETDASPDAALNYGVTLLKNASFDLEPNESVAQVLPGTGGSVVGHLGFGTANVLWVGGHPQDWNDGTFSVTQVDLASFPADLSGYDAIFVDSNAGVPSSEVATAISTFVAAGGGMVTENGGSEGVADYSWVPNAGTSGFDWLDKQVDVVRKTSAGALHPVTAGIADEALSNWSIAVHNEFPNPGDMLVLTDDGQGNASLLATDANANDRLVYLGMDASGHINAGESKRLVRQSLQWAANVSDVDRYAIDLLSGDQMVIDVAIPASGAGQYSNDLMPTIMLVDPNGDESVLLPADPVSATISGTYALVVESADGARGDYVLSVDVTKSPPEPGVLVSPTSGLVTSEAGATDEFTIQLATNPGGLVTIPVRIDPSNNAEVEVSLDGVNFSASVDVVFDQTNWSIPQTVTARGVDDAGQVDGDQPFVININPATSAVVAYSGVDGPDVAGTNLDDDAATSNVTVESITPISTIGIGGTWMRTIVGTGFEPGAAVSLQNGSGPAPTVVVRSTPNANTLEVSFTTSRGGPNRPRVWDICVANSDGASGCLAGGLTVDPGYTGSSAGLVEIAAAIAAPTLGAEGTSENANDSASSPDTGTSNLPTRVAGELVEERTRALGHIDPIESDTVFADWEPAEDIDPTGTFSHEARVSTDLIASAVDSTTKAPRIRSTMT